jgi:hypothetical protein
LRSTYFPTADGEFREPFAVLHRALPDYVDAAETAHQE